MPQLPPIGAVVESEEPSGLPPIGGEVSAPRADFRATNDPDQMVINGKTWTRADMPPDVWEEMARAKSGTAPAGRPFDTARTLIEGWGQHGPHAVVEGLKDVGRGNVAKGARQVISGTAITAAPMVAPQLVAGAVAAPVMTAAGLGGGLAAQYGVTKAGEAAGLTPDQAGLAGDLAGMAGGALAAKAASAIPSKAAPALREQAEQKVQQFLGPTKERYKAMGRRLTPGILKRGLGGSRASVLEQATAAAEAAGQQIDDVIAAQGSTRVDTMPVYQALETAKDAFRTTGAAGNVVEFEPRAIRQLDQLQQIVADLGPSPDAKQLIAIRRAWDTVVDQAGGYSHRAGGAIGVPLSEQTEAWAKREATAAIREQLAKAVPDLAAVNKEYSFWRGVQDVLTQTEQRTQPQQGGLKKVIAEAAGAAAGSSHGFGPAWATGKLAALAQQVFTSPRFRLLDARLRNRLADALASGSPGRADVALRQVAAAQSVMGAARATAPPPAVPTTAEDPRGPAQ